MSPDLLALRLEELSERIKRLRAAHGMTLLQLSKRSTVGAGTIAKIENRQMVPSIAVVMKIAAGLNIGLVELIAPRQPQQADVVEQAAGTHARLTKSKNLYFEKLSADLDGPNIHYWRGHLPGKAHYRFLRRPILESQVVLCERGVIEMDLEGTIYSLEQGDTLHSRGKRLVSVHNPRKAPSSYLVTNLLPPGTLDDATFESDEIANR